MAYIDRDLLLQDISDTVVFSVRGFDSPELRGAMKIIDRIEKAPTTDVVKCRNCVCFIEYNDEYKGTVEGANGDCWIRLMNSDNKEYIATTYDDFCSYGKERKASE